MLALLVLRPLRDPLRRAGRRRRCSSARSPARPGRRTASRSAPPIRCARASGTSSGARLVGRRPAAAGPVRELGDRAARRPPGRAARARRRCSRARSSRSAARWRPCRPPTGGFDRRTWLARQGVHETLSARSLTRGRPARRPPGRARPAAPGRARRARCRRRRPADAHRDGRRAGRHRDARRRDARGVPRLRARAPAGRLGRQRRPAGRGRARPRLGRGMPRALAHGCAIPAVAAYAAIVGGGPSVVRAAATGVLVSLAWLIGSARDPWHLLALAAAAVLALDPWAVAGPGFQLSFVAVAAIHGLAPPIRSWLEGTPVPLRLCSPLAISLACTLATAPGRARRTSAARRSSRACPRTCSRCRPSRRSCGSRSRPARSGRSRPGATVALDAAHPRARRLHRPRRAPRRVARRRAAGARAADRRCSAAALALARAPASRRRARRRARRARARAAPGRRRAPHPRPRARLRVTFLDVGQGDAALIEAPGLRALVDTGPPSARVERMLRRRGVTSLDALLLSHDELDHDGRAAAILRALRRRPARHAGAARARARACARRVAAARERGTRVVSGRAGIVLRRGAVERARRRPAARHARVARPTTRRWSCSRARAPARSCCPPTPSRPCCSPTSSPRRACSRSRTTAPATGCSARLLARAAPAPRRHLRGRAQHATATRRRRRSRRSPQAGVPVRRTDLEGDISLGCGARRMTPGTITAMSAAPLDPVYLIGGTDRPKVELAIRRLRARVRAEDGSDRGVHRPAPRRRRRGHERRGGRGRLQRARAVRRHAADRRRRAPRSGATTRRPRPTSRRSPPTCPRPRPTPCSRC